MTQADHDATEFSVLTLEAQRIAAINANDAIALKPLFTEDYVHVHASAAVQTRAEMIAYTTSNPRTIEARKPKVRVFGDVAILTGDMQMTRVREGSTIVNCLFVTQVACKIAEGWKFASFHATQQPE